MNRYCNNPGIISIAFKLFLIDLKKIDIQTLTITKYCLLTKIIDFISNT